MHAAEGAVEVRSARRRLREAATDERVGVFTPDKDGGTHTSCGRAAEPERRVKRHERRGAGPSVARWVASLDFRQLSIHTLY